MDHPIAELSECIFDYLASKSDRFVSVRQIIKDITSSSGHRCSALNKFDNNYVRTIVTDKAYNLENEYENVYKVLRNGEFYLIYSNDKLEDPYDVYDYESAMYDIDDKYDSHMSYPFPDLCRNMLGKSSKSGNLLHLLVRDGDFDNLTCFISNTSDSIVNGCLTKKDEYGRTPLDLAVQFNQAKMVKTFMDMEMDRLTEEYKAAKSKDYVYIKRGRENDYNKIKNLESEIMKIKLFVFLLHLLYAFFLFSFH